MRPGTWMPFAHAARELGWLSRAPDGAPASESAAERLTEAAGAAYVAEQTAAVEQLERTPPPEPSGPAALQVSVDGAMISLVGKQWVEVKTLAIGTIGQEADGTVRARDLSYFSRRAEHTAFRRLALVETHRRGVGTAQHVVAVVDGAEWLQRFIDFHRPDAIRVLDFPHAVEHLTRASHEAHGAGTDAARDWIATQAHDLKHDGPAPGLVALRALPSGEAPRHGPRLSGATPGPAPVPDLPGSRLSDRQWHRRERQQGRGRGSSQGQRHALGTPERRSDARPPDHRLC